MLMKSIFAGAFAALVGLVGVSLYSTPAQSHAVPVQDLTLVQEQGGAVETPDGGVVRHFLHFAHLGGHHGRRYHRYHRYGHHGRYYPGTDDVSMNDVPQPQTAIQ